MAIGLTGVAFAVFPDAPAALRSKIFTDYSCADHKDLTQLDQAVSVTASDPIRPEHDKNGNEYQYDKSKINDGNDSTAWIPDRTSGDDGLFVNFAWAEPQRIKLVCVVNGYASDSQTYSRNGAVQDLTVAYGDEVQNARLAYPPDDPQSQQQLPTPEVERTDSMRLTVKSVWTPRESQPGKQQDIAISEVTVYGLP